LHLKKKEPYWSGQKDLLLWLCQYCKQDLIFLGDVYDSSSPHNLVTAEFIQFCQEWPNQIYIIQGNHEYSRQKGSALAPLQKLQNVNIIFEIKRTVVEQKWTCVFLPYRYNFEEMKLYENIKESWGDGTKGIDYVFTHITPPEAAFADEGIQLDLEAKKIIHGHTHIQKIFRSNGIEHIILGVPQTTRNLEQNFTKQILEITEEDFKFIDCPVFMTIEDIEFDQEPQSKNNLLNVKNAPSIVSVYERYPPNLGYYIREEGIQLIERDSSLKATHKKFEFDQSSIESKFVDFALKNAVSDETTKQGLSYLEKVK